MSKMDDLRAMREARYAANTSARRATPRSRPPVAPPVPPETPVDAAPASPEEAGRCGHRSMNGRTCTREAGHAAKSHRYS